MATLLDELLVPRCRFCNYLAGLDWDVLIEWQEAIASKEVGHADLVHALRRRGWNLDEASVRRHRKHSKVA